MSRAALALAALLAVAACKQIASIDDLSAGGASAVSTGSAPTSSSTTRAAASSGDTGTADVASSAVSGGPIFTAVCADDFNDVLAACLTDAPGEHVHAEMEIAGGNLSLSPAGETGFWESNARARFIHVQIESDLPFVASTRVRARAEGDIGMPPGNRVNLGGLATRPGDQSFPEISLWSKNEAGTLMNASTFGVRTAFEPASMSAEVEDRPFSGSEALLAGVELGICRYDGALHLFNRTTADAAFVEVMPPGGAPSIGAIEVGLVAAAFDADPNNFTADFSGFVVETATVLGEVSCRARLSIQQSQLAF